MTITRGLAGNQGFSTTLLGFFLDDGVSDVAIKMAVEVIALTSVAANLTAIFGGIVFHEPLGSGPFGIGARLLAFCLVITGAALMSAPVRATRDTG